MNVKVYRIGDKEIWKEYFNADIQDEVENFYVIDCETHKREMYSALYFKYEIIKPEISESTYQAIVGEKKDFLKNDNGKTEWSLLPFAEMEEVVKVLMNGAATYGRDNWKNCNDSKRYEDALMRHVVAYLSGNKKDCGPGGDGLSHLAHAVCNCLFLMYFDNGILKDCLEGRR